MREDTRLCMVLRAIGAKLCVGVMGEFAYLFYVVVLQQESNVYSIHKLPSEQPSGENEASRRIYSCENSNILKWLGVIFVDTLYTIYLFYLFI